VASLFPKTDTPYICEMLPLETKQSGGKLLPQSDLQGECFQRKCHAGVTTGRSAKSIRNITVTRLEHGT